MCLLSRYALGRLRMPTSLLWSTSGMSSGGPEGDSVRYLFDVWVENEAREKVVVGTASALLPAEIEAR